MINAITLHPVKQSNTPVTQALQDVLASTYGLYLATHNYHWNVEGSNFVSLHKLFEGQYTELFEAIDAIAERIRSLGDYALPFEGDNILQISKMTSNSLNKEDNANDRADRMVNNLIALNEAVINHCQAAKNICRDVKDDETENMIVERVTIHQKAIWMLRSVLK